MSIKLADDAGTIAKVCARHGHLYSGTVPFMDIGEVPNAAWPLPGSPAGVTSYVTP